MISIPRIDTKRAGLWVLGGVVGLVALGGVIWGISQYQGQAGRDSVAVHPDGDLADEAVVDPQAVSPLQVEMTEAQQREIGLETMNVSPEAAREGLAAPGRIAPDETKFAYITPRTPGIVRSVVGQIGQEVRAGDVLVTIDSVEVGEARLQYYTEEQNLQIARTQADWQETIYRNTLDLIEALRRGDSPDQISREFEGHPVGSNRERLLTAYAQFRLAEATIDRNRELDAQSLITRKQLQQVTADYDAARATYQALIEQMGFETRIAKIRAEQALRQAETALRVVRERLRIHGVQPANDRVGRGQMPPIKSAFEPESGEAPPANAQPAAPLDPVKADLEEAPASTYALVAPFDGTLLDRELVVSGVAVDRNHRIFTLGDLSTIWVEANIHESDFEVLSQSHDGTVQFQTPAYPGRVFEGKVIYAGDIVDEKSRTVKLLARAENPDRLLKPGMFVEVHVFRAGKHGPSLQIPASALLTDHDQAYVFLRSGAQQFLRHDVVVEAVTANRAIIKSGLKPGDEVVISGAFKLKAQVLARQEE